MPSTQGTESNHVVSIRIRRLFIQDKVTPHPGRGESCKEERRMSEKSDYSLTSIVLYLCARFTLCLREQQWCSVPGVKTWLFPILGRCVCSLFVQGLVCAQWPPEPFCFLRVPSSLPVDSGLGATKRCIDSRISYSSCWLGLTLAIES